MTTAQNIVSKITGITDVSHCNEIANAVTTFFPEFYWSDATDSEIKRTVLSAQKQLHTINQFSREELMKMCGMV